MYQKSLIVLLVIVLLVLSFHFLLRGGLFSEQLTRFAASRIRNLTGTEVTVNRVTLSLVPAALVLEGVLLPSPEPDRRPIAIERIRVSVSPGSLLTEVTFIKKIQLIGPQIVLRLGESALSFLQPHRGKDPQGSSSDRPKKLNVVIRKIEIQNGHLVIQQASGEPFLTLTGMEGAITPDLLMKNFNAILSAKDIAVDGKDYHKRLNSMGAQFSFQSQNVAIRKLEVSDALSRYTVSGTIQNPARPQFALSVEASFPLADFEPLLSNQYPNLPISGSTQLTGEVIGIWPDLAVRGNLSLLDLTVASKPMGSLKTAFLYQNHTFSFSELSAAVFGGRATGNIRFPLSGLSVADGAAPYGLSLTFNELDPSAFFQIWGIEAYPTRQRLEGHLEIGGIDPLDLAGLTGKGWLHLMEQDRTHPLEKPPSDSAAGPGTDSSIPEPIRLLAQLQEASTRFEVDHGTLFINKTTIHSPRSSLTLQGNIRLNTQSPPQPIPFAEGIFNGPMTVEAALISRDIAEWAAFTRFKPTGGELELFGKLTGTIKDPVFKGNGRVKNLELRGRSFETAESDLSYQNRKIRFKKAIFREKKARYEINGLVSFESSEKDNPGPFFDVTAAIQEGSPRDVVALFTKELPLGVPATGKLTARGVPKKFRLAAQLQAGSGSIYGQAVDEGTVALILTQKKITFEEARAKRGETVISGRGWIRFKDEFEFSVGMSQAHLEDFDLLRKQVAGLKGPLSGRAHGRGSFRDPQFETELTLLDITYQDQSLGPGTLSAKVEKQRWLADLRMARGLTANGELEWKPDYPFRIHLGFNELDLKPWLGHAAANLTAVHRLTTTGTADVSGQVDGKEDRWKAMDASVHLTALTIEFPDYVITNNGDIRLGLRDGNATIQSLQLKGPGTALTASGGLQLFKSYNIFVSGEADLDLFRIVTKEIAYGKGLASFALQVTDRWKDPKIRGGLTIHDGLLKSKSLEQAMTITSVGLSFNERQILLESIAAELGGGRIQASGRMDLVRFVPAAFGMNLEITGARMSPFHGMTGLFDASLVFQGDTQTQSLKGEVLIRHASYERRLDWQTWVLEFFPHEKETYRPPSLLKDVALNIHIEGKNNLWINNNLAKLPLTVELLLKGTLTRPVLLGRIETQGGTFLFRRNNFKVLSGVVDFISPEKIRPIADVQAVTRVRNYQIDLNLVGPMDKFDLVLTSNPPLKDKNEILCLLTFGKPCRDAAEGSKEIGAAEATALVSGGIQDTITNKVEEITGIDRIQVDPYYSTTRSSSGPMITASKHLLDDKLYVTYATTLDPSEEQFIQLEYVISDNISLIGNRDEVGRAGGDLKFHFEFR